MKETKLIDENGRFKVAITVMNDIAVLDTHKNNDEDFEMCDCLTLEKAYEIANILNAHDELMELVDMVLQRSMSPSLSEFAEQLHDKYKEKQ